MKKLIILAAIIMMAGFSTKVMAQSANAIADINAEIEGALTITKINNLNFGRLSASTVNGTLVMSAGNVLTPTNVNYLAGAAQNAASYNTFGERLDAYTISLPSNITITNTLALSGIKTMTVSNFVSSKASNVGTFKDDGTDTFSVGATLNVVPGQAMGKYLGQYTVTIDYQ